MLNRLIKNKQSGFALPTVLIVSVIMLSVLAAIIGSTVSVRTSLNDQTYNLLAKNAADAGVAYARACLSKSTNIPTWSDAKPLGPGTDCNGNPISSTCTDDSVDRFCSLSYPATMYQTSFVVKKPDLDTSGGAAKINAVGSVKMLNYSNTPVWAWGYGAYGQLGNNGTASSSLPVQILNPGGTGFLNGVVNIASGSRDTGLLKTDGTMWMVGSGSTGQLGNNSTSSALLPIQVKDSTGTGYLSNVIDIAAGELSAYALKNDGTVWAWGDNSNGQLGINSITQSNLPVQVKDAAGTGFLSNVKAISQGFYSGYALKNDGTVWAWGQNSSGQLGNNTTTQSNLPVQVKDAAGTGFLSNIVSLQSAGQSVYALKNDGTVWAWGYNANGQLGNNTTTQSNLPVQVKDAAGTGFLTSIAAVDGGGNSGYALKNDGTVWAWGDNSSGSLGNNSTTQSNLPVQVKDSTGTGFLTGINAISSANGAFAAYALKNDGTVWAWGWNIYGQLGQGSTSNNSLLPVQVKNSTGNGYLNNIDIIAAGRYSASALENANVWKNYTYNTSYMIAGKTIGWGTSSSMAGKSCQSLLLDGQTNSGIYWIDPDQSGPNTPFQVYCDQSYSGGGWTLLMKATRGTTFNYDSNYWTTSNTLNESDVNLNDGDAKYRSFNEIDTRDLMARWPDINSGAYRWIQNGFYNNGTVKLPTFFASNSNYYISGGKTTANWTSGIFSSQVGNNWYGFNFGLNGAMKVRWGFGWNNETDWLTNDVSGGIGMSAQSYSAGDYISCCSDTTGMNRSARVEVYGRDRADQKDTNPETPSIVASGLVLSLDASSTSSYPGSGTTWYDLSGNGVNATMVGSPTFTTNYFTNFNGSNYFLTSAAYGPIPIGASSRTIIAGFRTPSSLSGYQHIIHYGTATQYQSFGLALYGGYLSDHTWSSASFFGNYALTPSTNYIGAVTFNDASSPRATLYVNGQAGATAYGPGVTTDYTISTGTAYQLYLGSRINPLEPLGADSRIYFVMVYNRALSSNEVLQNYNAMRSQLGL